MRFPDCFVSLLTMTNDKSRRLRRLKAAVVGVTATASVSLWAIVSGSVQASTSAPATTTGTIQAPAQGERSFFGDSSGSALRRTSSTPVLRSGGS